MTQRAKWLPPELKYSDYSGNWDKFLDDIYEISTYDFIQSYIQYEGSRLVYDSRIENGKEVAFGHIIQRGDSRAGDRVAELRRCERIPWPKPILEHPNEDCISMWENTRKSQIEDVNRGYYCGLTNLIIWSSWVGGPIE